MPVLSRFARLSPLVVIAVVLAFAAAPAAGAQKVPAAPTLPPIESPPTTGSSANSPFSTAPAGAPGDPSREHMMHAMIRERNEVRQKQIVDDTRQLVTLAKQLKDAVNKSNKDELSLEVVNYATEIEKLAKSVKDKMRDGE
ncbi:MAG TPA: hypothetical protein VHX37_16460 [Acidobacteriaceae bacterium]|jgi:hypothetical protein|nr:hypothetical protein [Acidobacteriaceae bacterium]